MKYKLYKSFIEDKVIGVIRIDSEISYTCIPLDESNTDYQEYLEWVAEGNTPEPADE